MSLYVFCILQADIYFCPCKIDRPCVLCFRLSDLKPHWLLEPCCTVSNTSFMTDLITSLVYDVPQVGDLYLRGYAYQQPQPVLWLDILPGLAKVNALLIPYHLPSTTVMYQKTCKESADFSWWLSAINECTSSLAIDLDVFNKDGRSDLYLSCQQFHCDVWSTMCLLSGILISAHGEKRDKTAICSEHSVLPTSSPVVAVCMRSCVLQIGYTKDTGLFSTQSTALTILGADIPKFTNITDLGGGLLVQNVPNANFTNIFGPLRSVKGPIFIAGNNRLTSLAGTLSLNTL